MCLGIPGQVVAIEDAAKKLGVVEVSGVRRVTNLACVVDDEHPVEGCVGDWVLVHVGFAMSRIDAEEAARTLDLLEEMGEVQAELDAMRAHLHAVRPPTDRFPGATADASEGGRTAEDGRPAGEGGGDVSGPGVGAGADGDGDASGAGNERSEGPR